MKHYFILILLAAAALGFSGCESDTPSSSTNSGKKELEILPVSITTERFVEFKVKARMTNIPQSDVRIEYDWGDGKSDGKLPYPISAGYPYPHSYVDTGSYIITVRAYDDFTDELLATKTIPAQVHELPHVVEFTQESIDTAMECNVYGNLPYLYLGVKTTAPYPKCVWNLGDGQGDSVTSYTYFSQLYASTGTYKVTVDVYDYKDTYWGSDTMIVKISPPDVTQAMLEASKEVTVCYGPDQSSPIYNDLNKVSSRFAMRSSFIDSNTTSSWYDNTFDLQYRSFFNDPEKHPRGDVHISGKVSTDFQSIDEVSVTVFDSIPGAVGQNLNRHGYRLSGLKLAAVNSDMIVYRVIDKTSSQFASNEYFIKQTQSRIGFDNLFDILYYLIDAQQRKAPYGYVIFSR